MRRQSELFDELGRVACPWCQCSDYALVLRCDLVAGTCASVARCHGCYHRFEFKNVAAVRELLRNARVLRAATACPALSLEVHLTCEVGRRQCSYDFIRGAGLRSA